MKPASNARGLVLIGWLLAVVPLAVGAQQAPTGVAPPAGLIACSVGSAFARMAQQTLARFGDLAGCFVSKEQIVLHGTSKDVSEPAEYAFAVHLAPGTGPHSTGEVQQMYAKVGEQWKNYNPLDRQRRKDYEKRLDELVASSLPRNLPAPTIQLEPPILVSMERIGSASYIVISIRQRKVVVGDEAIVTRAADASAITLQGKELYRLSIARELRASSDVETVHRQMQAWLASIGSARGNR